MSVVKVPPLLPCLAHAGGRAQHECESVVVKDNTVRCASPARVVPFFLGTADDQAKLRSWGAKRNGATPTARRPCPVQAATRCRDMSMYLVLTCGRRDQACATTWTCDGDQREGPGSGARTGQKSVKPKSFLWHRCDQVGAPISHIRPKLPLAFAGREKCWHTMAMHMSLAPPPT